MKIAKKRKLVFYKKLWTKRFKRKRFGFSESLWITRGIQNNEKPTFTPCDEI